MHALSVAFLIVALLLAVIFIFLALSFMGLFLSELGLWFFWLPMAFIIASIPFLINYVAEHPQTDFFLLLASTIINLFVLGKMLFPFLSVIQTNKQVKKQMCRILGEDYLSYVNPEIFSSWLKAFRFRLSPYFSKNRFKRFNKEIVEVKDVPYRTINNTTLRLNIIYPKKPGCYPVLLYIHGGGWMRGSKDRHLEARILKRLAVMGYTIFNVEYRLAPMPTLATLKNIPHDQPTIRQMVSDVRAAILFARQEAEKYAGDREHFFLFGRSAGAHLALLTAFSCEEKFFAMENIQCSFDEVSIDGVIAFYPITDIDDLYAFYKKDGAPFLEQAIFRGTGGSFEERKNLFKIFSPMSYLTAGNIEHLPPVFLAAGKMDRIVDVYQSEELNNELLTNGITSIFIELPWANHGFDVVVNGPGGQVVFHYMHQFLQWVINQKRYQALLVQAQSLGRKAEILNAKTFVLQRIVAGDTPQEILEALMREKVQTI